MQNQASQRVFPGLPVAAGLHRSRPARVCIASPEFIGPTRNGGIGTAYTAMARALAAAGHEVTCLYLGGKISAVHDIQRWVKQFKRDGIDLVPLPQIKAPTLDAPVDAARSYAVYAWLKQNDRFDVVHFPEWQGPGYYCLTAKRQGLAFGRTTFCIGTHSMTSWLKTANRQCLADLADLEQDFMERQSVLLADAVVSPSQYLLDYVSSQGWQLPPNCYVQQNILPQSARTVLRPASNGLQDVLELVFFGRLETRKGVVLFCDALDRLAPDAGAKIQSVTFLGKEATVENVAASAYIQKRAKRWSWKTLAISDKDQPQAIQYLSQPGRLAIIPSYVENSPYTVLECLGAGISFVASFVGGIPELIASEDISRVCFDTRPDALADRLCAALTQGFQPARAAVNADANEKVWVAWHESIVQQADAALASAPPPEPPVWPRVTICLTTFNRPNLLGQALASIETMEYPNLEVVLVDDGSTQPEALAALDELEPAFAKRGWQVVRQENRYLGAARNTGARHARGEYLLFMDDDNVADAMEISVLVQVALKTGADIVSCGMNYFSGQDAPDTKELPKGRWLPLGGAAAVGAFRNCFGDANALVRRSCFESVGGFTEDYGVTHEDWEFHAKAVLKGFALTVVPEFLFWYRVNPDSMIRTLSRYPNYMRSIRPYLDAVPVELRNLVYFAQGQHLLLSRTLGPGLTSPEETRLTITWRSKLEAARIFIQQKQKTTAINLLLDAIKGVETSSDPFVVLEALLAIGKEMGPLDRDRAEQLLRLAVQLSKALDDEELQQNAANLLASLASPASSAAPPAFNGKAARQPTEAGVPPDAAPVAFNGKAAPATAALVAAKATTNAPTKHDKRPDPLPVVSIIIPIFNKLELTRDCLDALARSPSAVSCEIILVDNASDDGTAEFLRTREESGAIRVLTNSRNEGFAHGCNQGAMAARGSRLLFLNNDTQVTPGWLDALEAAVSRPNVGIAGGKLLYANGSIQHAGIAFIQGVPDHPHRHAAADAPEVNRFRELDMVTGACLMIRRELFSKLAGFDESYRNGVEDIDLCLRARAAGCKVVYEPKAVVYHLEGQSAGRFDHVSDNLRLFFERWGKSFDGNMRFVEPKQPKFIVPKSSLLLRSGAPGITTQPIAVAWEGSFLDFGSLSHVNRELTRQLNCQPQIQLTRVANAKGTIVPPQLQGLARELVSASPRHTQITIRHGWPPNWRRPQRGALVVIQPWEYGALPEDWVRQSAQVEEFWVPSQFVRQSFVGSGVPAGKVRIVPNGIDPVVFQPDAKPIKLATTKSFKFLFVGGTIHRKGADVLLETYLRNFSAQDDVCLVIKDFGGQSFYAGQTLEARIRAAQNMPDAPEILYLNAELAPAQLPGLYTACDCLTHPYRGEGFGLPILEAMACGLPVIVTAGGAADDFAGEAFAYSIPASRKFIGDSISGMKLTGPGWLLEPAAAALAERMKWIFAHQDEARAKGRRASEHARREWTWERAARIAVERLHELRDRGDASPKTVIAAAPATKSSLSAKPAPAAPIKLPACALAGRLGETRDLLRRKKLREAWESALTAIAVRPFHPEAFLALAEIAQAAGSGDMARSCARHAHDLAPEWSPAKKFLKGQLRGTSKPAWLALPDGLLEARAPRLTICIIAKNEERFLGQCLASVCGLAAQIVVVDTGSTDRTVEIAKEHGAEVYSFAWCDDFSAARNAALERATGDWILALDADEELPPENHEALRKLLGVQAVMAWRLPIVDVGREDEGCCYVPRLFRNAPALFYIGRVHEQVFTSIEVRRREWCLDNRMGDAALRHHGYRPEVVKERNKIERNLRLLEKALEELPGEPNLLMNYGLELVRSGQVEKGFDNYRQAFAAMSAQEASLVAPETREMLLSQYCTQLMGLKRYEEIVDVLTSPLAKAGGLTASLHFTLGLAHLESTQFREAADQMRQCLSKRDQPCLTPINKEIRKAGPRHCLALCLQQLGESEAAAEEFRNAVHEDPQSRPARLDYARFLTANGQPADAIKLFFALVTEKPNEPHVWLHGGQVVLSRPEFLEVARHWTAEAQRHAPQNPAILQQRAEALLLSGEGEAALPLWRELASAANPASLAALAFCEIIARDSQYCPSPEKEVAVSREFLKWYRRLVNYRAQKALAHVNTRIEILRNVLPSAARALSAALNEASEAVPA